MRAEWLSALWDPWPGVGPDAEAVRWLGGYALSELVESAGNLDTRVRSYLEALARQNQG